MGFNGFFPSPFRKFSWRKSTFDTLRGYPGSGQSPFRTRLRLQDFPSDWQIELPTSSFSFWFLSLNNQEASWKSGLPRTIPLRKLPPSRLLKPCLQKFTTRYLIVTSNKVSCQLLVPKFWEVALIIKKKFSVFANLHDNIHSQKEFIISFVYNFRIFSIKVSIRKRNAWISYVDVGHSIVDRNRLVVTRIEAETSSVTQITHSENADHQPRKHLRPRAIYLLVGLVLCDRPSSFAHK